jgi:alpha-galactosidase
VVGAARGHAAFLVAQATSSDRRRAPPLTLPGLDAGAVYRVTAPAPQRPPPRSAAPARALFGPGLTIHGALLESVGLTLPDLLPETAIVLEAVRVEN